MRSALILLFASCIGVASMAQQAPEIEWQACFGGSGFDSPRSIQQTTDGGYIFAGETRSNNGQVTGFHGDIDFWVVRTDATGALLWQKALGGSGADISRAIIQTMDGNFVVAGSSGSTDGDLTGLEGSGRAWIVKLDANGAILWQHKYGSQSEDSFRAIAETDTGELLLAGIKRSTTDIAGCNQGSTNAWLVKLDNTGSMLWERCYGGSSIDIFDALDLTEDGGCILAGETWSNDGDVSTNNGAHDYWVVKVDQQGEVQWETSFGGSSIESVRAVKQSSDGGYIAAGYTLSADGDVTGHHGEDDVWVVKLDATGDLLWQRALGGSDRDVGFDVLTHSDGSMTIAGWTQSTDGDITQVEGPADGWLIRLDMGGTLLWEKTFGGSGSEQFNAIIRTTDGGFALCGITSSNDCDLSVSGGGDFWLVKLDADPVGFAELDQEPLLSVYPNPTPGNIVVELMLPTASAVWFTWFDALGRALQEQSAAQYPAGTQQILLSTEGLPSGPLFLQIGIGEQQHMRRVVKI